MDHVGDSQKLAERPDPDRPSGRKTLIETKARGGFIIIAPSHGKVHPTGGAYRLRQGGLETITAITVNERDQLWALARTFDEMPTEAPTVGEPDRGKSPGRRDDGGMRPGDDFEARMTWDDVLEPFGWKSVHTSGQVTYWRRPGKDVGWSATTGHCKGLKVFTSSTSFDTKGTYSKFGAHVHLNHAGNFGDAVKALVQAGYGTYIDAKGEERQNPPRKDRILMGAGTVDQIEGQSAITSEVQTATPAGREAFIVDKAGRPVSCILNTRIWLEDPAHGKAIRYDTFAHDILVDGKKFVDEVAIGMAAEIESQLRKAWALDHVWAAVTEIAHRNEFSSLVEWLDGLKWDGIDRVDHVFVDGFGSEDCSYSRACGRVFMLSGAARAIQPGCQADVMVILKGGQGIGKSTGLKSLCPDEKWFTDDLGCDLHDRKAGEGLRGKWLVEFSEFSRINRATLDVVKSFVTRTSDYFRPAYARVHRDFPRTCFFAGSTNEDAPLHDIENRRFMPIECVQADFKWLAERRDQLWAESVHRVRGGDRWWVSDPTLLAEVATKQEESRQEDCWDSILDEKSGHLRAIKMEDAAFALNIPYEKLDRSTQTRIGNCLKRLGYGRGRARENGKRLYVWTKP